MDLADRDRQASALAAAGMVAESVSFTSVESRTAALSIQGLQAPPTLAGHVPAPPAPGTTATTATTTSTAELDSINWNLMDLGQMHLDDLDMDFAQLFDPDQEAANMQTEGSGWPTAASATTSTSDPSASSVSPTPLGSHQGQPGKPTTS